MSKEYFSPYEREAIAQTVRNFASLGVKPFSEAIAKMAKVFRRNPLREFEEILREQRSIVYLIAEPMVADSETAYRYVSIMPYDQGRELPYFLSYLPGAEMDMLQLMHSKQSTYEINLLLLENTGLLYPRPGTQLSRQLHSRDN